MLCIYFRQSGISPYNESISMGLLVRALEGWDLGIRFSKIDPKKKEKKKGKQLCKGGIDYLTSEEQWAIEQLPTRLMSPSPPLLLRSNLITGGYIPCIVVADIDIQEYCFLKEDIGHMAEYLQSYCQSDTRSVNVRPNPRTRHGFLRVRLGLGFSGLGS